MSLAIAKLVEVVASGIGSVAGPILAPWKAKREGQAQVIVAENDARVLEIRTEAHMSARNHLAVKTEGVTGEIELLDSINERLQYQEQKRLANIRAVVGHAAMRLKNKAVPNDEPDHDWTARFFNDVQDVSSEKMQVLWGRILSGQVERPGSSSLRTLRVLRDLDKDTANLFARLCSVSMFLKHDGTVLDARVAFLGGEPRSSSLAEFGLSFSSLNRLHEHGLIIAVYDSWRNYGTSIVSNPRTQPPVLPFEHQGRRWVLTSAKPRRPGEQWKLYGVALSLSGIELSSVVNRTPQPGYLARLEEFFRSEGLQMQVQVQEMPDTP